MQLSSWVFAAAMLVLTILNILFSSGRKLGAIFSELEQLRKEVSGKVSKHEIEVGRAELKYELSEKAKQERHELGARLQKTLESYREEMLRRVDDDIRRANDRIQRQDEYIRRLEARCDQLEKLR